MGVQRGAGRQMRGVMDLFAAGQGEPSFAERKINKRLGTIDAPRTEAHVALQPASAVC